MKMKKKRSIIFMMIVLLGPVTYQLSKDIFKSGVRDGQAYNHHKKDLKTEKEAH